jgi:pimeloyl-ACP methyl ester carboxylesterase
VVSLTTAAIQVFYSDVPKEEADTAYANCAKHQSVKTFTTFPNYVESEIQCPKTYVLCEADQAIPAAWQEQMAQTGGYEVVRITSGHSPFITKPDEVVAIIEKRAEAK